MNRRRFRSGRIAALLQRHTLRTTSLFLTEIAAVSVAGTRLRPSLRITTHAALALQFAADALPARSILWWHCSPRTKDAGGGVSDCRRWASAGMRVAA